MGLLAAWDAAAIVLLVWVLSTIVGRDGSETERLAAVEDASPAVAEALLLSAGVASLVAVGFVLAEAGPAAPLGRGVLAAFAVVSLLLSWAVVHTIFTLRYARLYYAPPVGGIGFQDDALPDYADFVYVALTIGMTFQVSDTDLAKRPIRRAALHHAPLVPVRLGDSGGRRQLGRGDTCEVTLRHLPSRLVPESGLCGGR